MIKLKNITKKYGAKVIFKDFSINIDEGEFVAIMGESGCGKSTLLNIMGLLESADKGEVYIDGESNIKPQSKKAIKIIRNKISYLFQNFALVDEDTVYNNLLLALKYVKGERKSKINTALYSVGLAGYEKKRIYQLSGGEQQRVALARIILKPSKIILADEPTGSLDPANRDVIMNILRKIHQQGKTVIIVTHDPNVAEQCDRVIRINGESIATA